MLEKFYKECFLLSVIFLGLLLTLFFCDSVVQDELEHLRASYFVSLGHVPYRDFFEHHHMLIWYMFAPIMKLIAHSNMLALYLAKTVAFIFSLASFATVFLLAKRFLGGTKVALWSLLFYFFYFPTWYMFSIFKPDTFSRFFFLLGLYRFFCYIEKTKRKDLVWCALFFTIAFLFLQTSIFYILPLGIVLLYLAIKDKKVITDSLFALLMPAACLFGVFAALYYNGVWQQYFELNWLLNSYLFGVMYDKNVLCLFLLEILYGLACGFYLLYCKKADIYSVTILLLLVCETIFHIIIPPVYPHYLIMMFLYSAFLIAVLQNKINHPKVEKALYILLLVNVVFNFVYIAITNNKETKALLREYDKNPEAAVVVTDGQLPSIWAQRLGYYWMAPTLAYVDSVIFSHAPEYNINETVKQHKPLYIVYLHALQTKLNWKRARKKYVLKHGMEKRFDLDTKLLEEYEEILPCLYKRKSANQ